MAKKNYIEKSKNEFKQKRKTQNKTDRNYSFGFIAGEYY